MATWSFLTNHARALICIAHDPGVRLRDIAATLGITERRAFGIVTDLTEAGYVVKEKEGRRNRYRIQDHLPLREAVGREPNDRRDAGTARGHQSSRVRAIPDQNADSDGHAPISAKRAHAS